MADLAQQFLPLTQLADIYRQQMIQPSGRYVGNQWMPFNADQMVLQRPLPLDRNSFDPNDIMSFGSAPHLWREDL